MECDKDELCSVETGSKTEDALKLAASVDEERVRLDDEMENDLESEKEKPPETSSTEEQEFEAQKKTSDDAKTTVAKKNLQKLKEAKHPSDIDHEEQKEVAKGEIQDLALVQKCASNDDEAGAKYLGLGSPVRKVWGRESFSPVREVWGEEAFNKREEEEMEIEMEEEEEKVEKEVEDVEEKDKKEFEKQDEAGHAEDQVRSTGKRNLRK